MSTLVADVYALQAKYGFNHEPLNSEKLALRVDQVEEEFDEHRRTALEREQKVRRQLQDEINKQKKA